LFKNLGICKGSEEEKTLKSLIGKLCKSSPQMVQKIFSNCFWLSKTKQVRKEFIYSVATESIRMELAEIFDQKAYDTNPNGLDPKCDLLLSTIEERKDLFTDKSVLDSTFRNFQQYLDGSNLPNTYSGETKNQSDINGKIWNGWVESTNLDEVRNAVETSMLNSGVKRVHLPGKNKPTRPNDISQYLLMNYVFTQLILRHLRLPGQINGFPPSLHVIRKILREALPKIFPDQFNNDQPNQIVCNYPQTNAFPAESYSLGSPLSGAYLEKTGKAGIWGEISVYCILTAFFANDPHKFGRIQKEVVVMPLENFDVTAAYNFNYESYTENVSIPIMKGQYAGNKSVANEIKKVQRKVLPNAPINLT
jgi:hypothetical protein